MNIQQRRTFKIIILTIILTLALMFMLLHIYNVISSNRRLPPQKSIKYNRALRGSIISADGYTISKSEKIYSASIYGKSIDPLKRKLFIKLFSIYSNIPIKDIVKKMQDKDGNFKDGRIILSKNINASTAIYLKELAYKLKRLRVFQRVKNSNGIVFLYGLDIVEVGEQRVYPLSDTLSPFIGYVRRDSDGKYIRIKGIKGLEKRYQKYLNDYKDGFIKGDRDVSGFIILNKDTNKTERKDGYSIHLNISMLLQRMVEKITDEMKKKTESKEVMTAVMESKTGRILAIASSNRYNPNNIQSDDISKLVPSILRYAYEPGSVMKPITLSIALELKRVTPNSWFETYNGSMRISKRFTIHDDEPFKSMSVTDIITHSSNIGITQIGWRLSGQEFYDGLMKFGFHHRSGIDLSSEILGSIRSPKLLENRVNRATQSYGYGMHTTFIQLFKAYSVFNNDGISVTPQIVNYIESSEGKKYRLKSMFDKKRVISAKTARDVQKILRQVVLKGTATIAKYPGLYIGGKTGTAHISYAGEYHKQYNTSFFGFANDYDEHKYTIGVLVIEPNPEKHFASQTAVPTFKKVVDALVNLGYLTPKLDTRRKKVLAQHAQKRREVIRKKQIQRTRQIKQILKQKRKIIRKKRVYKHKVYKNIQAPKIYKKPKRVNKVRKTINRDELFYIRPKKQEKKRVPSKASLFRGINYGNTPKSQKPKPKPQKNKTLPLDHLKSNLDLF